MTKKIEIKTEIMNFSKQECPEMNKKEDKKPQGIKANLNGLLSMGQDALRSAVQLQNSVNI